MQINKFFSYTPSKPKYSTPSFKSAADELNSLWEDNPSTKGLWDNISDSFGMSSGGYYYPTNIVVHKTWDEVNGFQNLKNIHSTKRIYTGFSLVETPEKIKEVRDTYETKTIVDLVGYDEYKKACEKYGMKYFGDFRLNYSMYDQNPFLSQEDYITMNRDKGSKEELIERHKNATLKFNNNLKKLIKILDGGYVYMGCDHGHTRTNDAILLINACSDLRLTLDESAIWDIGSKRYAISQFKRNLELYSEDKSSDT